MFCMFLIYAIILSKCNRYEIQQYHYYYDEILWYHYAIISSNYVYIFLHHGIVSSNDLPHIPALFWNIFKLSRRYFCIVLQCFQMISSVFLEYAIMLLSDLKHISEWKYDLLNICVLVHSGSRQIWENSSQENFDAVVNLGCCLYKVKHIFSSDFIHILMFTC